MVLPTSISTNLPLTNSQSSVTIIEDGSGEKSSDSPDPRWPLLNRWASTSDVSSARPLATAPVPKSSMDYRLKLPSSPTVAGPSATLKSCPPTDLHFDVSVPEQEQVANFLTQKNHSENILGPIQSPSLKGAWTKKLNFSSTSISQNPPSAFSNPETVDDVIRFPWAAKMNPASRNLYRASEPEYLEDGTPKVTIPPHVLLQGLENQKEYVLGQFYRCSLPPGGLIYAVFNKLWGRNCRITIKKLGDSSYLFHIPEESTRTWVIQRGLWHVDDCLMFVAPWTPKASLAIPEIKTIPVWVTLKNIPNILYSIPGISHIASGLGSPMATHKPRLDPFFMGEAKILVEVELSKAFPPRIAADDKNGFISMVDVEYAWLPSKCGRCGQLGHKVKRCLQAVSESHIVVENHGINPNILVAIGTAFNSVPRPVQTITTAAPSIIEVPRNNASTSDDPFTSASVDDLIALATISVLENMSVSITHQSAPVIITINDSIESSILESTQRSPLKADTSSQKERVIAEPDLGSNKFSSLIPLEGEEDSMDSETDSMDLMTPSGKRILRERPVKPSAKAKDMHWQFTRRGRGNRGRGNRGGHS